MKNNNKYKILLYINIFLFILLTILTLINLLTPVDSAIESYVIGIRSDRLTSIMKTITNIARAYSLISISVILLFVIRDKKISLSIIINLICVFLTSQIAKLIFKRTRPDGEFLVYAKGYSYPSGHAMVSLAYFGFLTYLILKKINNKFLRINLIILTSIIILLIGFSRLYLGVHYATDIIGGYVFSIIYLIIFITIYKQLGEKA